MLLIVGNVLAVLICVALGALAVRFLVSDESSNTHGTVLDVDGGIANVRLG